MKNPVNSLKLRTITSTCRSMKIHIKSILDAANQLYYVDMDMVRSERDSNLYPVDKAHIMGTVNIAKHTIDHEMAIMNSLMKRVNDSVTGLIIRADDETETKDKNAVSTACDARTGQMWHEILDATAHAIDSTYAWQFHHVLYSLFQSVNYHSINYNVGIEALLANCNIDLSQLHMRIVRDNMLETDPKMVLSMAEMIRIACYIGETITITPDLDGIY